MAITESFEPSQYFNFEKSFLKNEDIFKEIVFFSVKVLQLKAKHFHTKCLVFLTAVWLSLSQSWAILEGAALLT